MRTPRLPGFSAAAALGTARSSYRAAGTPGIPEAFGQAILPQQDDGYWEVCQTFCAYGTMWCVCTASDGEQWVDACGSCDNWSW
jgi:hypothetical protein